MSDAVGNAIGYARIHEYSNKLQILYPDDELSYVHVFSGMFSALLIAFGLLFW